MKRIAPIFAVLTAIALLASSAACAEKTKITKLDDLPRYTYHINMKAADFVESDTAVMALATQLKRDLQKDLDQFEIADKTTLQGYYSNLGTIAMLEGQMDVYLDYLARRKALEDKEATRLTMGAVTQAYVLAKKSGDADFRTAYKRELKKLLDAAPYDKVQDNFKQAKGSFEMMSKSMTLGGIEAGVQPVLDKSNGEMSKDIATGLVGASYSLKVILPLKDDVVAVYDEVIKAHQVTKADIWAARDVTLTDKDKANPVLLAIWDSGVNGEVYKNQMWTNAKEIAGNNKDDDNNGFVNDVHGIAYSLHGDKESSPLFDVGDVSKERPTLQRRVKGLEDIQANIESPEAQEVKALMASLPRDSVKPVFEGIGKYANYAHGTHVAGIALRGNPYARVLASRITFDYHVMPELPTMELARKDSASMRQAIDYFKANGVRAVNMSWGGNLGSVEGALEANNAGGTPEERKALARKLFEVSRTGLVEAITNAPEILFIVSAGNSNSDVNFEEFYPSSINLPNVLTVGAVDQAGEETGFTSFGKVDVYANGFEVVSHVPGGDELKMSGTSQSSPNVTNLAGKLLAKYPKLTVAQLRAAIVNGCDMRQAGERKIPLLNPQKSMELAAAAK